MGGPDKSGLSPATTFALSAVSSFAAESATFPADIIKTRLQVQTAAGGHSMIKTFVGIVKQEGVLRLYNGLTPACLRHLFYSGSRMMIYEKLREDVLGRDKDGKFALWKGIVAGMSSGAIGQFIANPTDLVKVQMQTDGKRIAAGKQPLYRGTAHAIKVLYAQNGFVGMWRGWGPSCQRAALVQLGDLTSYDFFKQTVIGWGFDGDAPTTHAMASGGAGLVAAFFGTPADVIKTRMMNQPVGADGKGLHYSSSWHCIREAVAKEGAMSLYKGFVPSWLRMAPWSLVYFLTFEQLRKSAGLTSF